MFILLLSFLVYNLAHPPIPMSFPPLEHITAPVHGLEIASNSAVLGLEQSVTYRSNTPTPAPQATRETSSTKQALPSTTTAQVKAVNTQSGTEIEKVSEKAVEESAILEECNDDCVTPSEDNEPTATPTPHVVQLPIELPDVPKDPCPELPVEGRNGETPNRLIIPCPLPVQ